MGRAGRARRALSYAVPLVLLFALLELGFTLLCVYGVIFPQRTVRVFEASEKTIVFDPVLGVHITPVPSRAARLTDGKVDHVERFVGNAQGFSDRRDFTVRRAGGEELRLAVLGDSFSAMKALDVLWPERVEDLATDQGRTVRLFNFSIGGTGLANWWSVLQRLIVREGYELDGVIFAVFDAPEVGDLHRLFLMSDHAHGGVRVGLAPSWDPETWPKTWTEAAPIVTRRSRAILDRDTFERMLRGEYDPSRRRPWRPYLTRTLLGYPLDDNAESFAGAEPTSNDHLTPGPLRLAEELAQTCKHKGWPVYVVRIPSREDAMNRTPPSGVVREFARLFDAELIDGVDAFREIPPEKIAQEYWLPRDGHWNQQGSDAFARMMWERIRKLLPEKPAPTPPRSTS
jgi:hypothetical protein